MYRTTVPRRYKMASQELLHHYPFNAEIGLPPGAPPTRRIVYRHDLWASPLPDITGRFRECSPAFYRYDYTRTHRLFSWIFRELHYLLNERVGHILYVMTRIVELLPQHHINSPEFRQTLQRYFRDRTEHFLHELYCYASTPYDMIGYDRNVQYTPGRRVSTMINEVISSSERRDSVIVMLSNMDAEPHAGSSRPYVAHAPAPVYPSLDIPRRDRCVSPAFSASTAGNDSAIPIETTSQSVTDDVDDEVMVVGYLKPPEERTPEMVDLLGSDVDSDVIVMDAQPEPSGTSPRPAPSGGFSRPTPSGASPRPAPSRASPCPTPSGASPRPKPSVKLTLKRRRAHSRDSTSDSSDSYRWPPRRRRLRSPSVSDMSSSASQSTPYSTPPSSYSQLTTSSTSDYSYQSSPQSVSQTTPHSSSQSTRCSTPTSLYTWDSTSSSSQHSFSDFSLRRLDTKLAVCRSIAFNKIKRDKRQSSRSRRREIKKEVIVKNHSGNEAARATTSGQATQALPTGEARELKTEK